MSEVEVGSVYNCQGWFAEVTAVDVETTDAEGDWVEGIEFTNAPSGTTSARYVLAKDAFLASYYPVEGDEEANEHPPENSQYPADGRPPKATLY